MLISEERPYTTEKELEPTIIVGVEWRDTTWPIENSLDELERLVDTAGGTVVGRISQKLETPYPRTFIGPGKAEELAELARSVGAKVIVFDDELSPSQQQNLEKVVGKKIKVLDRTALILDIFGMHAKTNEGKVQVQLAQLEYLLPRLKGMWTHLMGEQSRGGIASRFGQGETQLEVDRRMVRKKISQLKRELKDITNIRETQRKSRYESLMFRIAIVGYTNAGKSTLLNALTDADIYAHDQLFATLDPTTRKLVLPEGRTVTITDTVGFIQKLPINLVESFKSTLAEAINADLILHVVDISSPDYRMHIQSVEDVLKQIEAAHVAQLMVFNKIDAIDEVYLLEMKSRYPHAVFVSAQEAIGIDELITALSLAAAAQSYTVEMLIPFDQGSLVSKIHEMARVVSKEYKEDGTHIIAQVPSEYLERLDDYIIEK